MPRTPWSSPAGAAAKQGGLGLATGGDHGAVEESPLPQKNRNRYEFVPAPAAERQDSAEGDAGASFVESTEGGQSTRPVLNLAMLSTNGASNQRGGGGFHGSGMRSSMSMDSLESSVSSSHRHAGDPWSSAGFTGRFSDTASMASFALSSVEHSPPEGLAGLPSVPACFRCPVSQQIMEDPVYLDDGRCVERANVSRLGYKGQVQPNESLKEAIKGYFELRGQSEKQQSEWQDYLKHREDRAAKKLLIRQHQVHALRLALDRSRRKVQDMKVNQQVACSPTLSIEADSACPSPQPDEQEAACKDMVAGSPAAAADDQPPNFRSGPAPRPDAEAIAAAKQQRQLRRSTWSSGRMFQGMRG